MSEPILKKMLTSRVSKKQLTLELSFIASTTEHQNQTSGSEFILQGLSSLPHLQVLYFLFFLAIYATTICGNTILLLLMITDVQLHTPMYFFLSNLSFIDICFSSTVAPKILENTLGRNRRISFLGCAAQMYFSLALGAAECITLAIMALDRYMAICNPLRYTTIMSRRFCLQLAGSAWTIGFLNSVIHAYLTFMLPFCRSNHVNHYLCEMPALFRLSCKDTTVNEIMVYISGGIIALFSFLLTLVSYVHIVSAILKIRSAKGRSKVFSTCGSHLTVVSMYYGTIIFMYLRPRSSYSPERDKVLSVLYTVVTPMLNPIIYSMRNKEVKGALRRALLKKRLPLRT
ncbi:olfactory receptor 5AR1-like [Pleurodeles waltl]|uniref:olfactory receptor 5AR1-like n=1 Tax=Pleurodeles waltl TaxID=8319 RepID=UPI003709A72E